MREYHPVPDPRPEHRDYVAERRDDERFIREAECRNLTGLARTSRWEMERDGRFPKRIALAGKTTAWWLPDIRQWQQQQLAKVSGRNVIT